MRSIPLALFAAFFLPSVAVAVAEPPALPDWLQPGARVTYFQGTATLATAGQILVQDDKGNWINLMGQKFAEKDNPSSGGAGLFQFTVLAADARVVAAETQTFVVTDAQGGRVTSVATGSLVGTPAALSDYWVSPADLAARPDAKQGGVTVRRMPYAILDRTYDALVAEVRTATTYRRAAYDLRTGLLLVLSTSSVGATGYVPNPNGTSTLMAGGTTISSTILADRRQLSLPWLEDPRPEELARGARLDFRGTYATAVAGSPEVPQALSTSFTIGDAGARWVLARNAVALTPVLGGSPQQSVVECAFGSASSLPLWIRPATIARLEPGTVVDEDPATHFRTTFAGVRGDVAVVVQEGPFDRVESAFHVRTGLLVASSSAQQLGLGRTQARVERVAGR